MITNKNTRSCRTCGNPLPISLKGKRQCSRCRINERKHKRLERLEKKKQRKINSKAYQKRRFTKTKRQCDRLWREAVIAHYGDKCVVCGSVTGTNMHHIISRANKSTRWYVPNGVPLCSGHHVYFNESAHLNPIWFNRFMIDSRGNIWEKELLVKSQEPWNKDIEEIKSYLIDQLS